MLAHTHHECPHCGYSIEVTVEINEDDGDLPERCPECDKPLDDPGDLAADALGSLIDRARDFKGDQ